MDTKESTMPITSRHSRWPALFLLTAGLTCVGVGLTIYSLSGADPAPAPKIPPKGAAWSYEEVFPNWPKDRKPDFVIVISGQTYGYLQKCGCSDPQRGGLERRFNFLAGLNNLGIQTIPIDLGDIAPEVTHDHKLLPDQALLKYATAMQAMKAMGYKAVGVGKEEFALGMHNALGAFAGQPKNTEPKLLGTNVVGWIAGGAVVPKAQAFVDATGKDTAIRDWELIPTKSNIGVGVISILGTPLIDDIKKIDNTIAMATTDETKKLIENALAAIAKGRPKNGLDVLLYGGPINLAPAAAKLFPQFRIVVARSEEAEPPNAPMMLDPVNPDSTMIVRVGHKGQTLGVVGVFKNTTGFELMYQRVSLTPEFETPDDKVDDNLALKELEKYSKAVRDRGFLSMNPKVPHPLQVINPNAQFAGTANCIGCHKDHGNADVVFAASKHAHAYTALSDIAKRPSLRNFDPECIRCHTVGYDYNTGFVNATKTPGLMNVGCENCHGPGSQHVALPNNKPFALQMSPWKVNGVGHLPSPEQMTLFLEERDPAKKQKIIGPGEMKVMLSVDSICQSCHNTENDPHFKIETYWPKIVHSLKPVEPKK